MIRFCACFQTYLILLQRFVLGLRQNLQSLHCGMYSGMTWSPETEQDLSDCWCQCLTVIGCIIHFRCRGQGHCKHCHDHDTLTFFRKTDEVKPKIVPLSPLWLTAEWHMYDKCINMYDLWQVSKNLYQKHFEISLKTVLSDTETKYLQ